MRRVLAALSGSLALLATSPTEAQPSGPRPSHAKKRPPPAAAQPPTRCVDGESCVAQGNRRAEQGDARGAHTSFDRGCAHGHGDACHALADLFRYAQKVDHLRAHELDVKGCKLGSPAACYSVGLDLESGVHHRRRSIKIDLPRAKALFRTACDGGVEAGCLKIKGYASLDQQQAAFPTPPPAPAPPAAGPAPAAQPSTLCGGLKQVLEVRKNRGLLSLRLGTDRSGHARALLPDVSECTIWGTREDVIYGCELYRTQPDPDQKDAAKAMTRYVASSLTISECLRRDVEAVPLYRGTWIEHQVRWSQERVRLYLRQSADGVQTVSINVFEACDRPNPESGLCWP